MWGYVTIEGDKRGEGHLEQEAVLPSAVPDLSGERIGSGQGVQDLSIATAMSEALSSEQFLTEYSNTLGSSGVFLLSKSTPKSWNPDRELIQLIGQTSLEKLAENRLNAFEEVREQGLFGLFRLGFNQAEVLLVLKVLTENGYDHPAEELNQKYKAEQFENSDVQPEAKFEDENLKDFSGYSYVEGDLLTMDLENFGIKNYGQLAACTLEELSLIYQERNFEYHKGLIEAYFEHHNLKFREEENL